jgi:hypothetical protein
MQACKECGAREVKGLVTHRRDCAQRVKAHGAAVFIHGEFIGTTHDESEVRPMIADYAERGIAAGAPRADLYAEVLRAIGSRGGKARASMLTAEQRSEAARKAAKARWAKP